VLDETGFLKQGKKSVGVKRQYSGTAGRVENCQIGVFLGYATSKGFAFLDRQIYLPQEWANDQQRREEARVPESVKFATKPQLARVMLERARAAKVPLAWVTADTVYGNDRRLREFLEENEQAYVLAVACSERVWIDGSTGSVQVPVQQVIAELPAETWQRLSCGVGSKGYNYSITTRHILIQNRLSILPTSHSKRNSLCCYGIPSGIARVRLGVDRTSVRTAKELESLAIGTAKAIRPFAAILLHGVRS
jgi:SRSO17 transposase